jgi:hypothetical protein
MKRKNKTPKIPEKMRIKENPGLTAGFWPVIKIFSGSLLSRVICAPHMRQKITLMSLAKPHS